MANNRNGLDVDKYDYLQRDSMYCNTKISVDIKRIFSFVKVYGPPLCLALSHPRSGDTRQICLNSKHFFNSLLSVISTANLLSL